MKRHLMSGLAFGMAMLATVFGATGDTGAPPRPLAPAALWQPPASRVAELPPLQQPAARAFQAAPAAPAPVVVATQSPAAGNPPAPPSVVEREADKTNEEAEHEEEEHKGPDGHPKVGGDHPGEAAAFRKLSLQDENGEVADGGLIDAANHLAEMRANQAPNPEDGAGITRAGWTWLGPGNIGGRVRALAVHPTTPSTMFAGGVDGGIWKTTNAGAGWAPVDDFMANLAVSSIVLTPGSPNVMYAGTGEGFYNADGIRGAGVFKSTDGGTTWSQLASTSLTQWQYVNRLAISPDASVILAATRTGVYRSTDAGGTWNHTNGAEMMDVDFHPTNSALAVASGRAGNAYYSTNGGATWTAATGLPGSGRVEIAYAPSSPTTVYASVELSGGSFYASTDGGATFALRFNSTPDYLGGQGWYGNALWVNPFDPNFVIVGGIDLHKSLDGGSTFFKISNWAAAPASAHADHHIIVAPPTFDNNTNRTVFFGNDGGVYRAADVSIVGGSGAAICSGNCSTGWTALNNNLGVTQFYGGAGHAGTGKLIGGTQDNGSLLYTPAGGVQGWTTTFGGDGGWSAIDPNNANNLYGEYVYLTLHRSLNGGGATDWINGLYWNGTNYVCKAEPYRIGDAVSAGCDPSSYGVNANFIAPFILDPSNSNRLLAGGLRLWRTNDATTPNTATTGPSWLAIKPSVGSNISAIAVAPLNSDIIWVGHNNGDVYKTVNGTSASPTWVRRDTTTPSLPNRFVTRITIDPADSNIVYAAFGGYSSDNLYRSMDGGDTWTSVVGSGLTGLPAAPIRDLEVHPSNSSWLYAATEVGLFASEDAGATWGLTHDGPANVSVDELFFMGADLVAVTHGRGMFKQVPVTNTSTVSVSGRVTNSANGLALQGVWVNFYDGNGQWITQGSTNASGDYSVTLAQGTYYASTANNLVFINQVYNGLSCATGCGAPTGNPIVVGPGGVSGINFALTSGGGRISGTVTNSATALPIANMSVNFYNTAGTFMGSGHTDGSGNYITQGGLPAGTYYARTWNTLGYIDEAYNNVVCVSCAGATGSAIAVTEGGVTSGINFALDVGGRVAGKVTRAGVAAPNNNLAGVSVQVYNSAGVYVDSMFTDASGNYLTRALPAGTYYARTYNGLGYVNKLFNDITCLGNCPVTSGAALTVTVGSTVSSVNFSLNRGGQIAGVITGPSSAPLAGIDAWVFDGAGVYMASGRTDASGAYVTRDGGLPAGNYFVRTANSQGYVNKLFNDLSCANGCTVSTGTAVSVTVGAITNSINFSLALGAGLSGVVTDSATALPLSSVTVQVYNASGTFVANVGTDSSGFYTFNGLTPGTYYARTFNSAGYVNRLYNNVTCAVCTVTNGAPITVVASTITPNVNFALSAGGRVAGTITNSSTGLAVAGVQVDLFDASGNYITSGTTDSSGAYIAREGMLTGSHFARTVNTLGLVNELYNNINCAPCSVTSGQAISVTTGATTGGINFALAPGGTLSGTVTNASTAAPLSGISVTIYNSSGSTVTSVTTNASGVYSSGLGLLTGNYFVRTASINGFVNEIYNDIVCAPFCSVTAGTPVAVTQGVATNNINLALSQGGTITGTVTSTSTGLPISGVPVVLYNTSGFGSSVTTNSSGVYVSMGLPTGTYYALTTNTLGYIDERYNDQVCVGGACTSSAGTPITVTATAATTGIDFALTPGATITGVVTNQANGTPLQSVTVQLSNASGAGVISVGTNSSGVFVTPPLPAGTYYARTTNTQGFVNELYNDIPCVLCSVTTGTPIVVGVTNVTGINFALTAGGRIGGTITSTVGGAPVAGVSVEVYDAGGTFVTSSLTDSSGAYLATTGLTTGSYFVRTSNSLGYINELYNDIACVSCTTTTGQLVPVTLGATTSGINFALTPGGSISGVVTNAANGAPLSGVSVAIYNATGATITTVNTNASGAYASTAGLSTGSYFVRTSSNTSGFVNEVYNDIVCSPFCTVTSGTPVAVTQGSATTGINFALVAGGSFSGTVTSSATGLPVSGVTVTIGSATSSTSSVTTNAAGVYTSMGLPTGAYYARTSNSLGFVDERYHDQPCVGGTCTMSAGTAISVVSPGTLGGINFALDSGGRVSGVVTDASTGAGLSAVTVTIYNAAGTSLTSTSTDASGNYTTGSGLPTGTYFARTTNSRGYVDELHNDIPCAGCSVVTGAGIAVTAPSTTAGVNFALTSGGAISGTVTNAAGGAAIPGVSVQIYNALGTFVTSATTNTAGVYATTTGLPAGSYFARTTNSLGFINELYNDISCVTCSTTTGVPISVTTGAVTSGVNFALSAGGMVAGLVGSAVTGLPLAGVTVTLYNSTGSTVTTATTNALGAYAITTGLPAGVYYARTTNTLGLVDEVFNDIACASCTITTGTPITVAVGATTGGVNFVLSQGGGIAGVVTHAAGGAPLSGVSVNIYTATGSFATSATTNGLGVYSITTGLPTGAYFARTSNTAGLIDELFNDITCASCSVFLGAPIAVTAGITTGSINFALQSGGSISGQVTDASGNPLPLVTVGVFAGNSQVTSTTTGPGGVFTTTAGLPTGTYFVRTTNSLGYVDEVFDDIPCAGCSATSGTPVAVTTGVTTGGINFALSPGGGITGTVTDAGTGLPLQGVTVAILNSTGATVTTPVTNSAGVFTTATGLPPGNYFARTSNQNRYIDELYDNITCAGCNPTLGTPIVVSLGAVTSGINIALVGNGGTVAGTVVNAATGLPLAGITITLFNSAGAQIGNLAPTSASGAFSTSTGLPTGTYFARTGNSLGFINELYNDVTCVLSSCATTSGTPISVVAGATTGNVNFGLVAGGRISGRVTNAATGLGLPGVTINIYTAAGAFVTTGFSDPAGNYITSAGFPSGLYIARTSNSSGFVNKIYNNVTCLNCPTTDGATIMVTAGATVPNIDFALQAGGRIAGRVTDTGGAPLSGINVRIFNSSGALVTGTVSDASGNYGTSSGGLPPGNYFAQTQNGLGLIDEVYNDLACTGCAVTTGTPIPVAAGLTASGIDFVLSGGGGTIAGRVTNAADGTPLAGVTVRIFSATGVGVTTTAPTDASGNYTTTTGLTAGNYFARTASAPGFINGLYDNLGCLACDPATGTPIPVALGVVTGNINFALEAGGRFAGRVTENLTGDPIAGVLVSVYNSANTMIAQSAADASGNYTIANGLPTGTYYARTTDAGGLGFDDQLYQNLPCGIGCAPSGGTPIAVTAPGVTPGIDFSLLGSAVRLTPSSTLVLPGASVTVTLFNGLGGPNDWLALSAVGSAENVFVQWTYVGAGLTSRTWTVTMPTQPGQYEFRLNQNNSYVRLATSAPVTVAAGISIADASINEGNSGTANATFLVTLSAASTQTVTVQYATANGTATAGSDYTAASGTLTFAPGVTSQTATVPILGDAVFEQSEAFVLNLSNPAGGVLARAQAVGTIRNDDAGPSLTIADVLVTEGNSGTTTATATVTLAAGPAGTVTVDYATANGTATAATDYTAATGTLTFAPGVTTQTFVVASVGDTVREANETFVINLTNASVNAEITDNQAVVTIIDDDGPMLTVPATTAPAGSAFTVTLANGLGGANDYIAIAPVGSPENTILQWTYVGAGVTARTWTITMPSVPGQYEFRLNQNATFVRLATSPAVSVVPGLSIGDVSVNEGNSGTANATFAVTLSAPSTVPVTVQYATANGTASAGSDYTAASGTLTFAPTVMTQTVTVPITGDTAFEQSETYTVTLSSPGNAVLVKAVGAGTIRNDDLGPTLSIADTTVVEGHAGSTSAVFTLTLSPVAASDVTVDYITAHQTTSPGDYVPTAGTVTFTAGATTRTISIPVTGDTTRESNETFAVNLSNASVNAEIGDAQGVATIVDDDGPMLTVPATTVGAGSSLTVTLANGLGGPNDFLTLSPSPSPDSALMQWTYVGNGVTARTWTVTMPTQPGQYEFRLNQNNGFVRLATSPTITVAPGLSIADVSVNEGNTGAANATFAVTLSALSAVPVTVQYATANGTATAGSDYTAANGTLTFAPGVLTQNVTVPILGDAVFEQSEGYTVTLTSPTNAVLVKAVGAGTIRNDDAGPTLSINDVSPDEGDSGTTNFVFTVTLAAGPAGTVTVDYATANDTATAGSDYTATTGTLTFGSGVTTQTITVPVSGDTTTEGAERFVVNLTNASVNAEIGDAQGVGTITEDDGPRITVPATTVGAGASMTITMLNAPGGANDFLALAPSPSPESALLQWTYVGGGVTTRTWTVTMPSQPGQYEFRLNQNNSFVRLATSPLVTVAPGLSISDVSVPEGQAGSANATFAVTLSTPSTTPVTVQYTTGNGTATAGSDFTTASGTLTFAPGVMLQNVTVPILGDTTFEPTEAYTVTLSNPTNAVLVKAAGAGTIRNDDAGPTLTINDVSPDEGNSGTTNFTFTVTLASGPAGTVTVDYATANGTAIANSDYTATSGTLTFAAGVTTQTISVPVIGDANAEGHETFFVNLTNASVNAEIGDAQGLATITEDDGPRLTLPSTTVGTATSLTVTLLNGLGGANDWIGLVPVGAPDGALLQQWTYVGNGVTTRTWTVTMPTQPGQYEFRLSQNNSYVRLATSLPITVAPGVSINDVSVSEGNAGPGMATFAVTLSSPSSQTITVQYATANGTATAGSDYTAGSGTLTFGPGVVSQLAAVAVLGDTTFEQSETFTVTLTSPANAVLVKAVGAGTIRNDDAGPTLTINDVTMDEGNSGTANLVFTVTLAAGPPATVTVDYTTANGTATAGTDYTAATGTLTFGLGVTTQTVSVPVSGDLTQEGSETFVVNLTNASVNAEIGDAQGVGTIAEDDGPRITLPATVVGAGSSMTVTLLNAPGGANDFLALSPSPSPESALIQWTYVGSGVTTRTWTVTMPASPGQFEFRLNQNNSFVRLATSPVVTVAPGISISDVSVNEGASGSANATFAVTLSTPSVTPVTVQYATANGTATAGSDYTAASGTLTFTPGVVMQNVTVPILGDTTFEQSEAYTVTLTSPTNAVLVKAVGAGTIRNDDAGPTLTINDVSLDEGNSGTANFVFTVSLAAGPVGTVTVDYATANGTATAGSDYAATTGTLTFGLGVTTQTITVPVTGDTVQEGPETFVVNLSNASVNAEIGDAQGTGTIAEDDGPRLTVPATTVGVGTSLTVTLLNGLGGANDWIGLVPVGAADGALLQQWTYVGSGVTTRTWTVAMPSQPGQYEFRLSQNNSYVRLATSPAVTVAPGLSVSDVSVAEGNSGSANASFAVTLSLASTVPVTVQYATANGTATAGSDYTASSGTLTFAPGVVTQAVTVPILGDSTFEQSEGYTVTLTSPTNAVLVKAVGAGTIRNDDAGPTLTIGDVALDEGNSGTTNFVFTVTLAAGPPATVTVDYATANGTATAGTDYTATSGTLTFGSGVTTQTITVPVSGDTASEGAEAFVVNLTNASVNAEIGDAQGLGTIVEDDGPRLTLPSTMVAAGSSFTVTLVNGPAGGVNDFIALSQFGSPENALLQWTYVGNGVTTRTWTVTMPSSPGQFEFRLNQNNSFVRIATSPVVTVVPGVSIGDVSLPEGNSGTTNAAFAVTLSTASTTPVTVQYATGNATATAGSDYTAASGTLTFAPGVTSQTVTVPIAGDTTFEQTETYTVTLSSPTNAVLVGAVGTGTIRNDDAGPSLSINDVSLDEGNVGTTNFVFTVTLAAGPAGTVTVDYATANGTATAGSDYTAATGTLTFGTGVTTQTITVPVTGDTAQEGHEAFVVNLTNASVNAEIGDAQGTGTISEDDGPRLTLPATAVGVGTPFTVTLVNGPSGGVNNYLALAPVGSSETTIIQWIYVGDGVTTRTWTVNMPSLPGQYEFRLNQNNSYVRLATSLPVTVAPGLSIGDVSTTEGNSGTANATFAVTLSTPSASQITVQYATANGTAASGSDYTATTGTLTFAPGVVAQNVTVPILGDTTFEQGETYTVTLSNPTNAVLVKAVGAGTIGNDDAGPTLSIDDVALDEGNSGTTNFVFTVSLAAGPAGTVTVDYATANGTASAGTDYTATTGTLTFGSGVTTQTITVPVSGDTFQEGHETFAVNLTNVSVNAQIGDAQGIGTITSDDGPRLTLPATVVSAGSSFTVTLVNGPAGGINNYIAIAPVGSSENTIIQWIYVGDGVTTRTWTINMPAQPGQYEFRLNQNNSYVRLATSLPITVAAGLSINDVSVLEGSSGSANAVFAVTLSAASTSTVTVQYATANATATADSDYTAASGTLTFAPGVTNQSVVVPILGDTTFEPTETYTVTLSNPANGLLVKAVGAGTIRNDDLGPTLTINDVSIAEGNSGSTNAVFTVSLSPAAAGTVTVDYATSHQTTAAGDYTPTTGTLTFAAGETGKTIAVPILGDTTLEPSEIFLVTLSNASSNAEIGDAQGVGTITNDEVPTLTVPSTTVLAGATVTVTLTNGLGGSTDWMALAQTGAPNTAYLQWTFVGTGTTGRTWSITMPATAGQYEFRLFTNVPAAFTRLATGAAITVQSSAGCADADADRLCDSYETNTGVYVSVTNTGSNPNVADTDGDGVKDGDEVLGTLAGLDLPAMGASPLRKNIMLEYDWFDDNSEPGSCGAHTHRPTQAMIDRVAASFAASTSTNPDGTTGITLIQDFGQGGVFAGGTLVSHAANITGGVNGSDFNAMKAANFSASREGYFHYVAMGHWYTDSLGSSGQAEILGDDLIVTLGCSISTNNVANTIMHELGHNLNLRHGGNENCNWKPNYNSVMNYRFQFPGVDTSCNAIGNFGETNVLDYSRGTRIALNENSLNENAGTCGSTAIDWNFSSSLTTGLAYDLNRTSSFPSASSGVDNGFCSATLSTLTDYNDWANMSFLGLGDSDGQTLFGFFLQLLQEESECDNPIPPTPQL